MASTFPLACFLSMISPPGVQFENALLQIAPVDKAKCPYVKENNDIGFQLYTRHNPITRQDLQVNDDEALFASNIDFHDPTVIYFHAFMENPDDGSAVMIREAYVHRGDTNVIMVDASRLEAGPWYFTAAENTWYIGRYAATFIDYLVSRGLNLTNTHLVGHSLGAQAAGVAGSAIKSVCDVAMVNGSHSACAAAGATALVFCAFNRLPETAYFMAHLGRISRITGLDPAYPLFSNLPLEQVLDPSDADFVDIIHTDAGIFGVPDQTGHVSFYPNAGVSPQPGCELEVVLHKQLLLNKCDKTQTPGYLIFHLTPTETHDSTEPQPLPKHINYILNIKPKGKTKKQDEWIGLPRTIIYNDQSYVINKPDTDGTNNKDTSDDRVIQERSVMTDTMSQTALSDAEDLKAVASDIIDVNSPAMIDAEETKDSKEVEDDKGKVVKLNIKKDPVATIDAEDYKDVKEDTYTENDKIFELYITSVNVTEVSEEVQDSKDKVVGPNIKDAIATIDTGDYKVIHEDTYTETDKVERDVISIKDPVTTTELVDRKLGQLINAEAYTNKPEESLLKEFKDHKYAKFDAPTNINKELSDQTDRNKESKEVDDTKIEKEIITETNPTKHIVTEFHSNPTKTKDTNTAQPKNKRQKRFVNLFGRNQEEESNNFVLRLLQFLMKHRRAVVPIFTVMREIETMVKSPNGELKHALKERNNYIGGAPTLKPVTYTLELGNENRAVAFLKRMLGLRVNGDKLTIN